MADNTITYRIVVKEVARKYGVYATFMPKPVFGVNGSGMTCTSPSSRKEKRLLQRKGQALPFRRGQMVHRGASAACAGDHPGDEPVGQLLQEAGARYEAPVYISWARRNRSTLVRVPLYKPGKENATRVEYRSPDPACNPYLAFACMLRAGLGG
jgi:glutamine synthetase